MEYMNKDKQLSRKEAAALLGVSGQQLDNYRKKGLITSFQRMDRGRHRYIQSEIEALLTRKSEL